MLNIQRREPDPQELIAVARRYGTVMVARAYADWSRQPEPFKGSLTAAMIDRVDCPAKQRDRIRVGTIHHASGTEQNTGTYQRPWSTGHTGPLPAVTPQGPGNGWAPYQDPLSGELDENLLPAPDEPTTEEGYGLGDYQQAESSRQNLTYPQPYSQSPTGPLGHTGGTGPLGYAGGPPGQHTGNTGHLPAINASGGSTVVQSTVVQSTVDLNMLMDIIETVFDRPSISTFVLMTGDKDFTRISARLKLRLNKTVIVVGIPGTVSRDLISSANQFVPLVPGGVSGSTGSLPVPGGSGIVQMSPSAPLGSNTGSIPAVNFANTAAQFQLPYANNVPM